MLEDNNYDLEVIFTVDIFNEGTGLLKHESKKFLMESKTISPRP